VRPHRNMDGRSSPVRIPSEDWGLITRSSQLQGKAGCPFSLSSTDCSDCTPRLTMEVDDTAHVETPILGSSKTIFQSVTPSLVLLFIVPVITFWLWTITSYFSSPLKKYPGPFLAKFTRLWYLYQVSTGDSHLVLEKLHKRYGPIVRITPSIIDVDIPEIVKTIFNTKDDWLKVSSRRKV
jgi:hypothetical protein